MGLSLNKTVCQIIYSVKLGSILSKNVDNAELICSLTVILVGVPHLLVLSATHTKNKSGSNALARNALLLTGSHLIAAGRTLQKHQNNWD